MRMVLKKKKKGKFFLKTILLLIILYVIYLVINQSISIQQKKDKIDSLNEQLSLQNIKNEEISKELEK